jgi:PAS domain S-box-containing protein
MPGRPILILAPRGRDAEVIGHVLARAGIAARPVAGLTALIEGIEACAAVVATEEALAGPDLGRLLGLTAAQPAWSDLPFLVLATKQPGPRSPRHVATLERLGNAILLERPLNGESLVSAAHAALRARSRQLAVRDLNATLEARVQERTEALAASEAQARAIFESFPECMFTLRVEGGAFLFEAANPAAEQAAGLSAADIQGRPAEAVLPPPDAAAVEARFRHCVEVGASLAFAAELHFPRLSGTFEATLTPLRDTDGRIARLLAVFRDVTARNALEVRLRQAQKMEAVGQLTGGVAHDFNNLLQVVLSGLTLAERTQDPERRAQLLDSVRRAAQRGGELTKRLLTVARRQSLRPEAIDLGAWFDAGAGELLTRTLRGDIRTELRVQPGLSPIQADPDELELAVLNLAVNARDAMPGGGTLTITAEPATLDGLGDPDGLCGRFVRLSVADTGTGMSEATQARVFEPFFTTKGVGQGTGLGLAQVYGFARQSGGGVRLRSRPGEGTAVSLLLPVSDAAPRAAASGDAADVPPVLGAAVLVCEDNDDVAALAVDMLEQLGHRPTRVGTAAAALGALEDGRPVDLLFTDVLMPGGMDGLALAREARRRRPGLPVLLTTGYTGAGAAAVPRGMPVLRKPYKLQDLAHALQSVLAGAPAPALAAG